MVETANATDPGRDMLNNLWNRRPSAMVTDGVGRTNFINLSMQQSLARANLDGRLVGGFKNVTDKLNDECSRILFCIVPENLWGDTARCAHFKLLVSACHSASVRVIKVDHDQLLRKIIETTAANEDDNNNDAGNLADLSYDCLAIMEAPVQLGCDRELIRFYQRHRAQAAGDAAAAGFDFERLPLINLIES